MPSNNALQLTAPGATLPGTAAERGERWLDEHEMAAFVLFALLGQVPQPGFQATLRSVDLDIAKAIRTKKEEDRERFAERAFAKLERTNDYAGRPYHGYTTVKPFLEQRARYKALVDLDRSGVGRKASIRDAEMVLRVVRQALEMGFPRHLDPEQRAIYRAETWRALEGLLAQAESAFREGAQSLPELAQDEWKLRSLEGLRAVAELRLAHPATASQDDAR